MQHMTHEAHRAALAGDWVKAIKLMDAAADQVEKSRKDVVNLARTIGGLSDAQVAEIRGVTASAVTQKFGARAGLLRDRMATEWEAARAEWSAEQQDDD